MSVFLNRCIDDDGDILWVANDFHEDERRSYELYVGKDVNGAAKAAMAKGLSRKEVEARVKEILSRDVVIDELAAV